MQVVPVYLEWFRRNSVLKCVSQPKIAKNSLKPPISGVRGRSRSSMLVPLESSSAVLVMIGSKSVSICNRFHARWTNNGEITNSKGRRSTPRSLMPSFEGNLLTQWYQITSSKLDTLDYHMMKIRSLYLTWAWFGTGSWRTDGRTDRIPIANTRSAVPAATADARKNLSRQRPLGAEIWFSEKVDLGSLCLKSQVLLCC